MDYSNLTKIRFSNYITEMEILMKRVFIPLLVGLLVVFAKWGMAADTDADEANVVAAIEKLGGQVAKDTESPTQPVVAIDLGKSKVADADLDSLRPSPNSKP